MAHILVIDDDEELGKLMLEMLQATGHSAVVVSSGLEGISHFRASHFDLVITDMMMRYGGLATIQILKAEFPNIGIIAMSGGGAFRLDYARGLGAKTTLSKPFTAEQLAAAVAEVMAARAPQEPRA
jgi:CheY-like chemotaxis protein